MAKKRANGEGNIRKRADGRWEGLVQYHQFETKEDACPYGYRRQ